MYIEMHIHDTITYRVFTEEQRMPRSAPLSVSTASPPQSAHTIHNPQPPGEGLRLRGLEDRELAPIGELVGRPAVRLVAPPPGAGTYPGHGYPQGAARQQVPADCPDHLDLRNTLPSPYLTIHVHVPSEFFKTPTVASALRPVSQKHRLLVGVKVESPCRSASPGLSMLGLTLCRILLHSRTLAGNFAPEAVGKL